MVVANNEINNNKNVDKLLAFLIAKWMQWYDAG
jgi:hypothetical protein